MYIPTMSLNELVLRLRDLGVKTSNPTVAAMIEAGAYPFAQAVRLEEDGKRVIVIYRKLFDQWVAERAVPEQGDPEYVNPLTPYLKNSTGEAV